MSWGGYSFIINLLPIHCLACIITGRLSARLYVAFAPLIVLGTLLAGITIVVTLFFELYVFKLIKREINCCCAEYDISIYVNF